MNHTVWSIRHDTKSRSTGIYLGRIWFIAFTDNFTLDITGFSIWNPNSFGTFKRLVSDFQHLHVGQTQEAGSIACCFWIPKRHCTYKKINLAFDHSKAFVFRVGFSLKLSDPKIRKKSEIKILSLYLVSCTTLLLDS